MSNNEGEGVIVVGAGAAGLTAAYDLKRKDIPLQVLEAHETEFGGRVRKLEGFAPDFNIDIGAEFIHFPPKILQRMVDDPTVEVKVKTKPIQFAPYYEWRKRGEWTLKYSTYEEDEILWKFVDSTWHDFLNEYMVPSILEDIHYGCVITRIDYSGGSVTVTCQNGRIFSAAQVVITVPIPILQQNKIQFHPPLPAKKQSALAKATFEPGFKVFLEFSQKFYYQSFGIHKRHKRNHGEMYFYDEAALNNSTGSNVLGIFAYGDMAQKYVTMTDEEILQTLLAELDEAYKGRATQYYIKGYIQNWSGEPHIGGNYSSYRRGMAPMYALWKPLGRHQVFFAGEHLPVDGDYGFVTGAAFSGRSAAQAVVCVREGKKVPFPWRIWLVSSFLGTLCCGWEQFLFFRDV